MKARHRTSVAALLGIAVVGLSWPVSAQDAEPDAARLEKLEKRLAELERQLARQIAAADRAKADQAALEQAREDALAAKLRAEIATREKRERDLARIKAARAEAAAVAKGRFGLRRAAGGTVVTTTRANANEFQARFATLVKRARKGDAAARRELLAMRTQIDRALGGRKDKPFMAGAAAADRELNQEMAELRAKAELAAKRMAEVATRQAELAARARRVRGADVELEVEEEAPEEPEEIVEELEVAEVERRKEKKIAELTQALLVDKAPVADRYRAAVELGRRPHPSAVRALEEALAKDENALVRRAAAFSLGALGKHSQRAMPALIRVLAVDDGHIGLMADRSLRQIARAVGMKQAIGTFDPTASKEARQDLQADWLRAWNVWHDETKKRRATR